MKRYAEYTKGIFKLIRRKQTDNALTKNKSTKNILSTYKNIEN